MKNILTIALTLATFINTVAQDVNCTVKVIHPKIQISNTQIFASLENSISQFVNQKKWSDDKIALNERIQFNILVDVTQYQLNSNDFSATIQIQATRPVFGSTYNTVIFNQFDEEFDFQYQEFQAMEFQLNANVNNLTGVLAFYTYIVIGLQYDTYSLEGGTPYYQKAQGILNASQQINGWRANDGKSYKNRYYIIDNISSDRFRPLRKGLY
ncbi:MAG: DUF4835 family protein, partial [Bacteroidia bacterium]|nr:DUF4835 family protein [Bacteroidia bacterium]